MTRNQIEYWRLQETERNNRAVEKETNRANLARERETNRSNLAREAETHRTNVAVEKETQRSHLAGEQLTRLQMQQNLFLTRLDQDERARSNRANEQINLKRVEESYRSNRANEVIARADQRVKEIDAVTRRAGQAEAERANKANEQLRREAQYETQRSNKAQESLKRDLNAITQSYNQGRLSIDHGNLAQRQREASEIQRHNLAQETETHRANTSKERIEVLKAVLPLVQDNMDSIKSLAGKARVNYTLHSLRR